MYRKVSPLAYYAISPAEILEIAVTAVNTGRYSQDQISEALKEMMESAFERAAVTIDSVSAMQLAHMALPGEKFKDPQNGALMPLRRALTLITAMYLKFSGRCEVVPQMLRYRSDPSCTIDELALLSLNTGLETVGIALPKEKAITQASLRQIMLYQIGQYADHLALRERRIQIIRDAVNGIAYQLKEGLVGANTLTQKQRTLMCHVMSKRYGLTAKQHAEEKNNPSLVHTVDLDPVARGLDPIVQELMATLDPHVEEGPKRKYFGFMTNGTLEDLILYYGPYAPLLQANVAYVTPMAGFSTLGCELLDKLKWDQLAHIKSVTRAMGSIEIEMTAQPASRNPAGETPPVDTLTENPKLSLRMDVGPAGTARIPAVLDDPEIIWQYVTATNGVGKRSAIRLSYDSKWRRRMIPQLTNYRELLLDRAFSTQKVVTGGVTTDVGATPTVSGMLTLDKVKFVDLTVLESQGRLVPLNSNVQVTFVRQGTVRSEVVSMAPYFESRGNQVIRPAFSDFYRYGIEDLDAPQENYVSRVTQRLGLSVMERQANEASIRAAVNLYVLKNLLCVSISPQDEMFARKHYAQAALGREASTEDVALLRQVSGLIS